MSSNPPQERKTVCPQEQHSSPKIRSCPVSNPQSPMSFTALALKICSSAEEICPAPVVHQLLSALTLNCEVWDRWFGADFLFSHSAGRLGT